MSREILVELITRVAELRCIAIDTKRMKDTAFACLQATDQWQGFQVAIENLEKAEDDVLHAELELKGRALEQYKETGEKKPIEKVEVKIYNELVYDFTEIQNWCRTLAPYLLVLDKKGFEKKANDFKKAGAPVAILEEAKCTIGTDLSMYLKEEKTQEVDLEVK